MADSRKTTGPSTNARPTERLGPERQLVVVQRNPASGSGKRQQSLRILIRELRSADFKVRLFADRDRLDEYVGRGDMAERIRCLVAAGGDGTVGSLVNRHPRIPIATLPLGTENLVARHLKIKRCGRTLAGIIKEGYTRQFDTGRANQHTFLLMASVGIDADVVRRINQTRSGNIKHYNYLKPILASFFRYQFPVLSVHSADGKLLAEGSHVIVTNIPEYGFRMKFASTADPHSGRMDVRVFRRSGRITTIAHAIRTRLGWNDRGGEIQRFQLQQFEIRSNLAATPGQIDGDPSDDCPLSISVKPLSMTLVVPNET